jgi:glyoxylase-like metal-dependent hydrolase (beta-lactamase superfamily II)
VEHRRREPASNIFRLVLPLPFPGLDRVNAYLLTDENGSTLVDCGIWDTSQDRDHGWDDLVAALAACGKEPSDVIRLVITHPHIDHYGMAGRVVEETGAELWMHREAATDLEIYRNPKEAAQRVADLFAEHGVERDVADELSQFEDWRAFIHSIVEADVEVDEVKSFTASGRTWEVVHTPGHARSHVCLWSAEDRLLISGDHLLPTITPHIDYRRGESDPLGDFLVSLDKTEALAPELVLPGHGAPFEDGGERARIVSRHHERRLGAIVQIIRKEPHTANEITDELFGETLLNFERRLALGEALAHIAYLLKRGEIEAERRPDGSYAYRKVRRRRSGTDDQDER